MATTKKVGDAGQKQAQDAYDEAASKGYYGQVPDQPPNEAYSIQTGPESPDAFDQTVAASEQRVRDMRASTAGKGEG